MKKITQAQYYQLVGLRAAAEKQTAVLDALQAAAREITDERDQDGSPETGGHTTDFLWGSRELDDMLRILQIEVESAAPSASESQS